HVQVWPGGGLPDAVGTTISLQSVSCTFPVGSLETLCSIWARVTGSFANGLPTTNSVTAPIAAPASSTSSIRTAANVARRARGAVHHQATSRARLVDTPPAATRRELQPPLPVRRSRPCDVPRSSQPS